MRIVKHENYDWNNKLNFVNTQNTKVGDVVEIVWFGSNTVRTWDATVTKVTQTTIHVSTHESPYLEGDNHDLHEIFRKHHSYQWRINAYADTFERGKMTLMVKA